MGTSEIEDFATRFARVEARQEIQQLASRYALAVDTRNIDALVALFVEDVQVGRHDHGREALAKWFTKTLGNMRVSIHQVMNHIVDVVDADHATGVVYCRDELERDGKWLVGVIQYWDDYERRDGRWYFKRRRLHRWYLVDALERPAHGAGMGGERESLPQTLLPDAWPSWQRYWDSLGEKR